MKLDSFNLKDIKLDPQKGFENLIDLRKMNIGLKELSGAFHVPRDWVLLERTLLLLTGVCTQLDPEMNPMEVDPAVPAGLRARQPRLGADRARGREGHGPQGPHAARGSPQVPHAREPRRGRDPRARASRSAAQHRLRRRAAAHLRGARRSRSGFAALELHLAGQTRLARYCLYGSAALLVLLFGSMLLTRPK